jgi:hypothetical protein
MGYSRDSFYRFKERYETGGIEALKEITRRKPNLRNRIAPEIEHRVVARAIEEPAWGQVRLANEFAKEGVRVSPAGVRCIWVRHDLQTMPKRLAALEALAAQDGRVLTEAQVAALEAIRMSSTWPLKISITRARRPSAPRPTGSASASTRPC